MHDLEYFASLLQENQLYNLLPLPLLTTLTREYQLRLRKDSDTTSRGPYSPFTTITVPLEAKTYTSLLANTSSSTHKPRTHEIPSPTSTTQTPSIEIYTVYTQNDERFFLKIKEQLDILRRQGWPISCHENEITHNTEWQERDNLETAHLILLLISTTFLNSDFCYSEQVCQAVKRHRTDRLCYVMPIILHPILALLLERTPFGTLDFLPTNGKPVDEWKSSRKAYNDITGYILKKIQEIAYYLK